MIKEKDFGRDHWSVLLYVECRCVDCGGWLDIRHLRQDGIKYPTRLKRGIAPKGHNDISCLEDLDEAGYIDFRNGGMVCSMLERGWQKAQFLRKERAKKGLQTSA